MRGAKWDSLEIDDRFMELLKEEFPNLNFGRVRIQTSGIGIRILRRLHGAGMAIGHCIFIAPEYYDLQSPRGLGLIAHELKHVDQHERQGQLRHGIKYAIDFARNGCKYSRDLPLEKEAYDLERNIVRDYTRILVSQRMLDRDISEH